MIIDIDLAPTYGVIGHCVHSANCPLSCSESSSPLVSGGITWRDDHERQQWDQRLLGT